ncbi:MAG TPA: FecR domain-containing protein [Chloroflexota bacterium]
MSANKPRTSKDAGRTARAEASVWMVRLHGEDRNAELEAGFQEWLRSHPENARQFEHIADVWDLAGTVKSVGLPRMRSWPTRSSPLRWSFVSIAALSCVAALILILQEFGRGPTYVTEHGEQRLLRLADGSSVYLNSDSRLHVEFDGSVRRVSLEHGEGLFEVAKDPHHPFVVKAGSRQVTALGTTFVVRYEPSETTITLVEGKVAVLDAAESDAQRLWPTFPLTAKSQNRSAAGSPDARPDVVTLRPGQRLLLDRNRSPRIDTPPIDAVTAWRHGQVLLEASTLKDAVSEMNRYDRRPIVIDDPQLNAVRVEGVYRTGDSLGFAHAVAELHHLEVTEEPNEIHLRARAPQQGEH